MNILVTTKLICCFRYVFTLGICPFLDKQTSGCPFPVYQVLQEECWTSENKTQTQMVGGKEDLLHYWASTWISPKMAPVP
jgi:hypothetical protein